MTPRISLAMIVKDEEATLPVCLGSIADLVDEIVVVDTGSTDRTRDVAARFGARVHDVPWPDSFAAARNASLSRATGSWIFWLDADDFLDVANRRKLQVLFESLGDENSAYLLKCVSRVSSASGSTIVGERPQLFRNRPDVRWENRVHEQIVPAIVRSGGILRTSDVEIQHTGYQEEAHRLRKEERNLRLSRLDVAERPDDPCILFHLGKSLLSLGRPAEALPVLERGLERADPGESLMRKLFAQVAHTQQRLGRLDQALATCQQGRQRFPDDVELLYQESYLRLRGGDLAGAESCLLRILHAPAGAFSLVDVDPALRGYRVHFNLAIIYRRQGRLAEAERAWRAVLAAEPRCTEAWIGLVELYLAQRRGPDLERLVQHLQADPERTLEAAAVRARLQRFQPPGAAAAPPRH
jgi:tetratricopeptide (TPR) repeat protein